jgi:hypothetical protein
MDSNCQEPSIHGLPDDKLNDLVIKRVSIDSKHNDPADKVNGVGYNEVPQHHVSHEEDQGQRQLDLQLVEPSTGPGSQVLELEGQQDHEDDNTVDQKHVGPPMYRLDVGVVEFINE